MKLKKTIVVLTAATLVAPSFLVAAETNDTETGESRSQGTGQISSKDEVVYANLSATGEREEIYVVNILDIERAGNVIDYGPYTSLKNLSNLSQLEQNENAVEFHAPEGKFYYQGNMDEAPLPWDVSVSYLLDGTEITPEELAGANGRVQIKIATSANETVDPVFFENYLLQISLSLNLEIFNNIEATDGMLANAGKNKQVTFTVMPEKEEELIVEADVLGFELEEGINITAIPSSMPIDAPDIGEMTGEMQTLTDAIAEINNGIGELENGVGELNGGVSRLSDGSDQYKNGILKAASSSSELLSYSKQIQQGLDDMSNSLKNNSQDMGLGELKKLEAGLREIASGLEKTTQGLTSLNDNYTSAYNALDDSMAAIPAHEISEEEIQQLYLSGADQEVIDQLVETYGAALTAKGTYTSVKEAFAAVNGTLEQVSGSLTMMVATLEEMANGLSASLKEMEETDPLAPLKKGLNDLASGHAEIHSGWIEYTNGVSRLASEYKELHGGILGFSEGTGEVENGISELHNGTTELYQSTSDLPDQMKEEIDQMMAEYDKSDFDAVSFVSSENESINSVQFVIKTESINYEEPERAEQVEEEEKGFWSRLKDLFS